MDINSDQVLKNISVVWSPNYATQTDQLQGIQRRFVHTMVMKLGYAYKNLPVHNLEKGHDLVFLKKSLWLHDVIFSTSL